VNFLSYLLTEIANDVPKNSNIYSSYNVLPDKGISKSGIFSKITKTKQDVSIRIKDAYFTVRF
jgi:hypothetical protein